MKGVAPIVLVAILASVFAGCLSTAPTAEVPASVADVATPGVATAGTFHLPDGLPLNGTTDIPRAIGGEYLLGVDSTEPTIGVDKAGNVYMTAQKAGAPTIMRTSDKGQTWKDVGPVIAGKPTHTLTFDPYVYVDHSTGRVFMDDIWPLGCGAMSWSDDQGATWTNNPASCGNPNVNDHQTVVAAKPRTIPAMPVYPNVVYRCVNNVGAAECAMSYTGGLTFTPQVPVFTGVENTGGDTPSPNVCGALTGHLAAAPDGTVFLPRGGCGFPEVATTKDDGLTWQTHVIDKTHPTDEHEVSIAVDEANQVYATWQSKGHVWMAVSKDGGNKWGAPIDVVAPGVTATMFNHVAAGAPGKIAIVYLGSTVPGGYEGKPSGTGGPVGDIRGEPDPAEWANATWNAYMGIMLNATDENPVIQSVTLNDPKDPLARGLCGGTRCHGMNDFIDVALDHDGRPWASFVDVCTQKCVTDPSTHWDKSIGFAGTLQSGPALRGPNATLPPILPPPAPKGAASEPAQPAPLGIAPARKLILPG